VPISGIAWHGALALFSSSMTTMHTAGGSSTGPGCSTQPWCYCCALAAHLQQRNDCGGLQALCERRQELDDRIQRGAVQTCGDLVKHEHPLGANQHLCSGQPLVLACRRQASRDISFQRLRSAQDDEPDTQSCQQAAACNWLLTCTQRAEDSLSSPGQSHGAATHGAGTGMPAPHAPRCPPPLMPRIICPPTIVLLVWARPICCRMSSAFTLLPHTSLRTASTPYLQHHLSADALAWCAPCTSPQGHAAAVRPCSGIAIKISLSCTAARQQRPAPHLTSCCISWASLSPSSGE
jgi:hypothetical protein